MTNLFTDIKNSIQYPLSPSKDVITVLEVEAGFSAPVGHVARPTVNLVTQGSGFSYEVLIGSKFKWTRRHDKNFLANSDEPTASARADEFIKFFDEEATKLETGAYIAKNGRPPFIMDLVSHLFIRTDATGFKG